MGEYLRDIIRKLLLHWLSFCGYVFVFMCEQVLICLCTYACGDHKCLYMYVLRHLRIRTHPGCLFMNWLVSLLFVFLRQSFSLRAKTHWLGKAVWPINPRDLRIPNSAAQRLHHYFANWPCCIKTMTFLYCWNYWKLSIDTWICKSYQHMILGCQRLLLV